MWGQHLLVDACGGDRDAVRSGQVIADFAAELVQRIDMRAYGTPTVVHFAEHTPEAAGYSLVQLIETSSITGHFVDCNGDFYLDVFSCKPFDADTVVDVVSRYFAPADVQVTEIERDARGPQVVRRLPAALPVAS